MDTIWVYVFLCTCVWCVARVCVRAYVCMNEYTKGFWLENERKVVSGRRWIKFHRCVLLTVSSEPVGDQSWFDHRAEYTFFVSFQLRTYLRIHRACACHSFRFVATLNPTRIRKISLDRVVTSYVRCVNNKHQDLSLNMIFDRLITQEKL